MLPDLGDSGLAAVVKGSELIDPSSIIADCKSGVSGAGRNANIANAYCESSESVKAYAVARAPAFTRNQTDPAVYQTRMPNSYLLPHLMPMIRGMHATVYADAVDTDTEIQQVFETFYRDEPFVDVMPEDRIPKLARCEAPINAGLRCIIWMRVKSMSYWQ